MLANFRAWYLRNHVQITWFLIGFLIMGGLANLGDHDYTGAILSFGIAFVNYLFVRK